MKRIVLSFILLITYVLIAVADSRPVIGISDTHKDGSSAAVPRSYVDAVLLNGGIPVVIPLMQDNEEIIELINSLDGIIFTGGEDFDPAYYKEKPIPQMGKVNAPRDRFDLRLLHLAAERGVPILGICRGVQLINIGFGGTLYQDLPTQYHDKSIKHRQTQSSVEATHSVTVEGNTNFADIVKERVLMVNSAHHQAVKDVAKGFKVAGKSSDRIVEVIEKIDDENWILGVQFHPEMRVTRDKAMSRIFQEFIAEAGSQSKPERSVKTASVPQTARQSARDRQTDEPIASTTSKTPPPQVIYKTVIDTQYIYKNIIDTVYLRRYRTDTLYVSLPPDTVYITTIEKRTVRVKDTVFVPVPETKTVYVRDPIYLAKKSPPPATPKPASKSTPKPTVEPSSTPPVTPVPTPTVEPTSTVPITPVPTPTSTTPVTPVSAPTVEPMPTVTLPPNPTPPSNNAQQSVNEPLVVLSDTMIFTPGEVSITKKADSAKTKKSKSERKRAKQQDETVSKEPDPYEIKLTKAEEKELIRSQKENAKLDKQELKEQKKKEKQARK